MYNFFKRLLDIAVSFLTLIILLPVFIPIIIILRLSAEGEVFYFQERYGIHNSRFQIWKFATMLKNSMNIGTGSITLHNDPRVTRIGYFLRKTKINELPQIINILKGDKTVLQPNITFHMIAVMQFGDWGVEASEAVRVTETGSELFCNLSRELHIKG